MGEKSTGARKWVRIAYSEEVPLREGRAARVNGREISIFNLGSRFLAIENRCPHRGGPLADGIVSGTTVVCPLHAWKFSLESGSGVSAPSRHSCVNTFPTRLGKGIVWLELAVENNIPDVSPACLEPDGADCGIVGMGG